MKCPRCKTKVVFELCPPCSVWQVIRCAFCDLNICLLLDAWNRRGVVSGEQTGIIGHKPSTGEVHGHAV